MAPGVTGTDTGGSIRQPAAFVGISGIKPTYGRCSRWGIVAFASSLDQAGPMARTVRDCAIMLEAMSGFDPKDSTSLDLPVPQWEAGLSSDLKGKRVGIPTEYRIDGVPAEIDALWEQGVQWLRDAGAEPVKISCRTANMRFRPITSLPRPKPRPTSPAMTASATACAKMA
jgi:aspartyl-tRNA(Asn)/glutamyl-tRNA(Gln) amidotransferase subunit A